MSEPALRENVLEVQRLDDLLARKAKLPPPSGRSPARSGGGGSFAQTRQTLALMERVAACVQLGEPVLLVGETGGGKTTLVQELASRCGHTLLVQNLSLQTDAADLLGG